MPRGTTIHRFSRFVDEGFITRTATDAGIAYGFTLADLPGYLEFTALFDRWRITNVEAMLMYQQTSSASTFAFPLLLLSDDFNDNLTPALETVLLERENLQTHAFGTANNIYRHSLKPRVLALGGGSSQSIEVKDGWVDCLTPTVDFYGLKLWLVNYNTLVSGNAVIRVLFRYDLEFQTAR